ncbi:MAG: polyprenyl synthetase family protein [Anaerovoracaceae bacterium]
MDFMPDVDHKSITLYESMKYSLSAGGKRIRPVLLLAACDFCGGNVKEALPYACAIEYIHKYSLIHDDLPCMDNDELRRGVPTNHIVYGEAVATLAGDGLQSAAFETMNTDMLMYFDDGDALKRRIRAAYEISEGSGCRGIVAGQIADMEAEDRNCSEGNARLYTPDENIGADRCRSQRPELSSVTQMKKMLEDTYYIC